ncbi:hypothetical protein U9M48_029417 [Paspalum notatum var. saurae]|uniref:Uncharacterized protein n=1 Tax=Paspalum notatum var. saurae TaxID=547442 RepID=A0AAQ3X231_PASNO
MPIWPVRFRNPHRWPRYQPLLAPFPSRRHPTSKAPTSPSSLHLPHALAAPAALRVRPPPSLPARAHCHLLRRRLLGLLHGARHAHAVAQRAHAGAPVTAIFQGAVVLLAPTPPHRAPTTIMLPSASRWPGASWAALTFTFSLRLDDEDELHAMNWQSSHVLQMTPNATTSPQPMKIR